MTRAITTPTFLPTREYERFTEFADAVRLDRYTGLRCGPTASARPSRHGTTPWDATEEYFIRMQRPALDRFTYPPPAELAARAVHRTRHELGLQMPDGALTDLEALAAIARIIAGNLRLLLLIPP
jgi:hypothetical protein